MHTFFQILLLLISVLLCNQGLGLPQMTKKKTKKKKNCRLYCLSLFPHLSLKAEKKEEENRKNVDVTLT